MTRSVPPSKQTIPPGRGLLEVLFLGLLVLGVGSGVGCGKGEELPTVSFFTTEYTARTATDWKELEKRFNEDHKDLQVAITVADWGSAKVKLDNLLKEGEPLHLATLPAGWLLEYLEKGHLEPLGARATENFLSRFHPSALRSGLVGGERYGLPFGLSMRFLYTNRQMLRAALGGEGGAAAPPATWEALAQVARAMQAIPDDVREEQRLPAQSYGVGVPLTSNEAPDTFAYFLWTAGGRFFDDQGNVAFDSPEGRQALAFLVGLVSGGDATNPDPVSFDRDTLEALFRTEKVGLLVTGHWLRGVILEERARVSFSQGALPVRTTAVAPVACDYLVMFKGEQKEEAWQFVDFIYRPENREGFLDPSEGKSVIPELLASLEALPAQRFWQEVKDSLEVARFMPLEPDWPQISGLLAKEVAAAVTGEKSPEQALADAARAGQKLIDDRRAGVGASL